MVTTTNWDSSNTTMAGDTTYSSSLDTFTLTADANWEAGLVTSDVRYSVDYDFTISFQSNFGSNDFTGADGITWLMHDDPAGTGVTPGAAGWELGTTNIENAWAVEFDTFDNGLDPSYDHTQLRGQSDAGGSHDFAYAYTNHEALDATNVEDAIWHDTTISWDVSAQTLTVTFDGVTVANWVFDVGDANGDWVSWDDFNTVLDGEDRVYFTFGGATGGESNEQAIRSISMTGTICFVRGTMIRTPLGDVPIEGLKPGDEITILGGGTRAIRWIGHSAAVARGDNAPIRFDTGAIGNALPLEVSPQHRIHISGWQAQLLMG